jgi:hypothetical protein
MDRSLVELDRERRFLVNRMKVFVEDWGDRTVSDASNLEDLSAELKALCGHADQLLSLVQVLGAETGGQSHQRKRAGGGDLRRGI